VKRSKTVKNVEAFSKSRFTLSNKLSTVNDITFVNEFYSNLNTKKSLTKTIQRKKIHLYRPQNTPLRLIKTHQVEKNQA